MLSQKERVVHEKNVLRIATALLSFSYSFAFLPGGSASSLWKNSLNTPTLSLGELNTETRCRIHLLTMLLFFSASACFAKRASTKKMAA
jgi:hypothetical protein